MTIEEASFGVAVLAFIFGDGLFRHVANLTTRRFKWETGPLVDSNDRVRASISHDYPTKRSITHALVVVQQPLLRRLLFLLRGEKLGRWFIVIELLDGQLDLEPGLSVPFTGTLPETAKVPTWNVFRSRVKRQTEALRLICLIQASRRRVMTRKLKRVTGSTTRPNASAAEPG